jgi:type IV secretion system protein VirD4
MTKPLRLALGGVVVGALCVALFGYLASATFIVLYTLKFDIRYVGFWTTFHYAAAYWTAPAVKWRLITAWCVAALVAFLPLLLCIAAAIRKAISGPPLYGDARFATSSEIRESGLLGNDGIIVGKRDNRFLTFDGQQFVLLYAPTRSGKGVSIVVPNLLNWADSVVALDIKPELWRITSGFRQAHGQQCYMFAPLTNASHRWNPLAYISSDPNMRITDIQKIAVMFIPDMAGTDKIWTANPRRLFLGVVLCLVETPGTPVTIGEVLRQLSTPEDSATYFARVINEREESGQPLSFSCKQQLLSFIGVESEKTRSGIKESLTSALELWANPAIDAATSANDFDLRALRRTRMSVYICLTPNKLQTLAPLINLFFQQLINLNTETTPDADPSLPYKCLLVLDEFPAIGKVGIIANANAYIAGFNLRLLTICQSPSQIRDVYGYDLAESFFDNHALEIIFATKNPKIQREISEKLGNTTVKAKSRNRAPFAGRVLSVSESDTARALVLPQDVKDLGSHHEILLYENMKPIRAKKIVYWKDRAFKARAHFPPASVPILDLAGVFARQTELQAGFAVQSATTAEDGAPTASAPPFVDVTLDNLDKVLAASHTISMADLDFPHDLKDRMPETVATEEEVDALVNLFLSESQ